MFVDERHDRDHRRPTIRRSASAKRARERGHRAELPAGGAGQRRHRRRASEIVAGALKNLDRALIIGTRTFGKGSVQELYDDEDDGSELKLTIAQYLTPGDVSIQGVGIVPDIEIEPMTVDAEDMDLFVDSAYLREADLAAHLTHARAHDGQKPTHVMRYYLPVETRERLREARAEDLEENEREDEFLTKFARELLVQARRSGRRELLRDAEPVVQERTSKEMARAEADLKKLGVDWSKGEDQGPSDVAVTATTDHGQRRHRGRAVRDQGHGQQQGQGAALPAARQTKSDNQLFSERELVFGKVMPGENRSWSTTLGFCKTNEETKMRECRLPETLRERADGIKLKFDEANGHAPAPVEVRTQVEEMEPPQFAYTVHVADDARGNGDGAVQLGELATVYMRIRNVGKGVSAQTVANLRNLSGPGILLHAGRFQLKELKPGQETNVAFQFEVLPEFDQSEAKLEASVIDEQLREGAGEKLTIPIDRDGQNNVTVAASNAVARAGAPVLERPEQGAKVIAS